MLDQLTCAVCKNVARDLVADDMAHKFGHLCISNLVTKDKCCPVISHSLESQELKPMDYDNNMIKMMKVKCMNYLNCDWQGIVDDMETHLSESCQEEKIRCHHKFCKTYDRRIVIMEHQRICRKNVECEPVFELSKLKGEVQIEGKTKPKSIAELQESAERNLFDTLDKKDLYTLSAISKSQTQDLNSLVLNSLVQPMDVCPNPQPQIIKPIILPTDHEDQSNFELDMPALQKRSIKQSKKSEKIPKKVEERFHPNYYYFGFSDRARKTAPQTYKYNTDTSSGSDSELESSSEEESSDISSSINQSLSSKMSKHSRINFADRPILHRKSTSEEVQNNFEAKLKFDLDNKARDVHINSSGDSAICSTFGNLVPLNKKMIEGRLIKFSIIKGTDQNFGIGICFKSVAIQNKFEIKDKGETPGCYLIFADGCAVKNQQVSFFPKIQNMPFRMETNDTVSIRISYKHKNLSFINNSTQKETSIPLKNAGDLTDAYPCVYLSKKDESVRLHREFPNPKDQSLDFDVDPVFFPKFSLSEGVLTNLGNNEERFLALLNQNVVLDKEYKFHVKMNVSPFMAFGFCIRSQAKEQNFEKLQSSKMHGSYLLSSENLFLENGQTDWQKTSESNMLFETGDLVKLSYQSLTSSIVLNNISKNIITKVALCSPPLSLEDFYPCVLFSENVEHVEFMTD